MVERFSINFPMMRLEHDTDGPLVRWSDNCTQTSDSDRFRETFVILHNVAMWDLEDAGVIRKGDKDKWSRFNHNLTTFVLKLNDPQLDALWSLVASRLSATQVAEAT